MKLTFGDKFGIFADEFGIRRESLMKSFQVEQVNII